MALMAGICAIIFDLDDTLYLERDYTFSGYAAVAAAFADVLAPAVDTAGSLDEKSGDRSAGAAETKSVEAQLTSMMRSLFDTPHRPRVFNEMLRRAGRDENDPALREMIRTFREHAPRISLLPDAQRALDRLRGKFKLGLLTDGPAAAQRAKITALGIEPVFDEIVVTDEIGKSKPDPAGFEMLAKALSTPPEACAYIGDNPTKDFIAPRALGWRCVRVVREGGVYADATIAPGGEPNETITSLDRFELASETQ